MKQPEIYEASVTKLAQLIRSKQLSPVEVTNAFLQRIDRYNPILNAFCTVAGDQAIKAAKEAEKTLMQTTDPPPLLGIPIAIKDLCPTKGIRTTFGSNIFADYVPDYDSVIVSRLKQAGAIVLGKTNTPEFGYTGITDNLIFGRTNNPWDITKSSGGSSGGSATAVAAGLVPAAEGSDGGGSIRIPASCCGVFGLKPSYGRIPYTSARTSFSTSAPFLHEGFLTNTVEDAALLLGASQGPDSGDPFSVPISQAAYVPVKNIDLKHLKLAYSPNLDYFEVDHQVQSAVAKAVKDLEGLGWAIEPIEIGFADYYAEVIEPFVTMWSVNLAAFYAEYLEKWETKMSKGLVATIRSGRKYSAIDYKQLETVRSKTLAKVEDLLTKYDLLVTPTLGVTAFPHAPGPKIINGRDINQYTDWMLTALFNLTGHPAASINCGYSKEGLPIGMQLIGPRYKEELILGVAKAYQEAVPQNFVKPNLNGETLC